MKKILSPSRRGFFDIERRKALAKTPLKWVGGKRWIVPILKPFIQKFKGTPLVELFAGGAALSFKLEWENVVLNDKNPHLINFYVQLKQGANLFSSGVEFKNERAVFYKNREKFNKLIQEGRENTPQAAALFYYLNKTAYNGLMRFNSKGFFNTPFGKYKKVNYTFDTCFYKRLFKNWIFTCKDFTNVKIPPDAIVYADPPYDVEFTNYNAGGFSWEDQVRLVKFLSRLENPVILSNQATQRIVNLYREYGFILKFVDVPRYISCKSRKKVSEVIAYKNV